MIQTIVYTVLIYSFILTVVQFYKDSSSYSFGPEAVDIIFAGPVSWILFLFIRVAEIFVKKYQRNHKPKEKIKKKKIYSTKQIDKIVKKVINARKNKNKKTYRNETYVMKQYRYDVNGDCLIPLSDLVVKSARYEWLNNKYMCILNNQFDDMVEIISKYFEKWTLDMYNEEDFSKYWVDSVRNEEIWRLI